MEISANGIRIHYAQEGAGPDLLFIPGLGASVAAFRAQLKGLASIARVTVIDPRGHGRSEKPHGPYSIGELADDAAAFIEVAGLGPAVVAGSSMSAMTAVELAFRRPELVAALILIGGFPKLPPAGRDRMEGRARAVETDGMDAVVEQVAATALGPSTHLEQPALVGLFQQALAANDPAAYAASCRAVCECDVTPMLPGLRCPVLILFGAEEMVAPLPAARALKSALPAAQVATIPKAGHLPFLEQPAAFNAAVQQFLAGLPL